MVERRTRGEQLFEEAKAQRTPPKIGNPVKAKWTKLLADIRGLFTKQPAKGGTKQAPGTKKPAALSAILNIQKLDLKSVNQALGVILAGLVALTAYVLVHRPPDISKVTASVSKINFEDLGSRTIAAFKELTYYLDEVKKRDIFNEYVEYVPPPPVVKAEPPPPPPPPPKVTIQEKAKNLKLMGISWGDNPKVIIKDVGTNEVLFLKKGQKIKGTEITVKEIGPKDVIIASEGDEMKLL